MVTRGITATAFTAAILAFLLPFGAVSSCDGQDVRFTGLELASFRVAPDRSSSSEDPLHEEVERNGSFFAAVTLLAVLVGLVLSVAGRPGSRVCAIVALVALGLTVTLVAFGGSVDDGKPLVGVWIILASLIVAEETPWYAARIAEGVTGRRLVIGVAGRYAWLAVVAAYVLFGGSDDG
jgi:hypothetical protein